MSAIEATEPKPQTGGFTVIELLAAMVIVSVLAAVGTTGVFRWRNAAEHRGSSAEIVSALRKAAERSISEGRTYCMAFTGLRSYALWRFTCGTGTQVEGTLETQSSRVTLDGPTNALSALQPCLGDARCVYFFPRGIATAATILVRSSARDAVYTIHVEGLTARVYQ